MDIFIGYDPVEAVAFHTCVNSIIRHSSVPVTIHPLALNNLQAYSEEHGDGSNEFIYSRFLVPWLMSWRGRAVYMDGDMVVLDDIAKLFATPRDHKALHVVKHDYVTTAEKKYLGQKNENYPRKNWSSVVLFNASHPANRRLSLVDVQERPGRYLHGFSWLHDSEIGELPPEWNHLVRVDLPNPQAKLVHFTLGIPTMPGCDNDEHAVEWFDTLRATHAR